MKEEKSFIDRLYSNDIKIKNENKVVIKNICDNICTESKKNMRLQSGMLKEIILEMQKFENISNKISVSIGGLTKFELEFSMDKENNIDYSINPNIGFYEDEKWNSHCKEVDKLIDDLKIPKEKQSIIEEQIEALSSPLPSIEERRNIIDGILGRKHLVEMAMDLNDNIYYHELWKKKNG